jgi:hypothetical protein
MKDFDVFKMHCTTIKLSTERCFYNSAIIISFLIKIKLFVSADFFLIYRFRKKSRSDNSEVELGTAVGHLMVQLCACAAECTVLRLSK